MPKRQRDRSYQQDMNNEYYDRADPMYKDPLEDLLIGLLDDDALEALATKYCHPFIVTEEMEA